MIEDYAKLFPYLALEDVYKFVSLTTTRHLKAQEIYIDYNSNSKKFAYVQQGMIRSYYMQTDGQEKTVLLRWESQFFASYQTVFENIPSQQIFQALEDCDLLELDYHKLEEFINQNPKFEKARLAILQKMLIGTLKRVESFILETPEERYLNLVAEQPEIYNRVPSKYIASYLGITPVSLSRIRKRIIEKRKS